MISGITNVLQILTSVAVLAIVAASVSPANAEQVEGQCFRDWAAAQSVVRRHRLSSIDQLSRHARKRGAGQVVKAVLCRTGDTFEYRVILRDARGQLTRRIITARAPFTVKPQQKKRLGANTTAGPAGARPSSPPASVAIVSTTSPR
ncbi:MAG: hypothetical protein KDJ36_07800 [Hyphomicrobiaceae bacterium]|nr:hypothetical protein [Hyphomicrobiaceae bacterium]